MIITITIIFAAWQKPCGWSDDVSWRRWRWQWWSKVRILASCHPSKRRAFWLLMIPRHETRINESFHWKERKNTQKKTWGASVCFFLKFLPPSTGQFLCWTKKDPSGKRGVMGAVIFPGVRARMSTKLLLISIPMNPLHAWQNVPKFVPYTWMSRWKLGSMVNEWVIT